MPINADLICFDNDGTLFLSHEVANPAIQHSYVEYCRRHGHDLPAPSDEEICRLTGLPGLEFFVQLLPEPLKDRAAEFRAECVEFEAAAVLETKLRRLGVACELIRQPGQEAVPGELARARMIKAATTQATSAATIPVTMLKA